MSGASIIWFVFASACFTLTRVHDRVWGRRRKARACLLIALSAGGAPIFALNDSRASHHTVRTDPNYLIDTWETEDGLPENSVTAMVQAPDGYLWFGTFNGLVRFDGMKFTVFDSSNLPPRCASSPSRSPSTFMPGKNIPSTSALASG